jgi:hypothetical protein
MVVVRGQDAVLLMLPIADLAWRRGLQGWRAASIVVSGPILMLGLQLALWWGVYGPTFPQEVRRGGNLLAMTPHVADYLLSARHGLDRTLIHGGFGAGEVWLQPARAAVLGDAARNRRRVSRLGRRGRSRLDHLASARPLGAASYGQ